MPPGSPHSCLFHQNPAYLFLILNPTGRKQTKCFLFCVCVFPSPPKKCCPNKLFEHGKMSWTASLETNTLNPVVSQLSGDILAIYRTLILVKIVPLVQGPGSTSSDTLFFPACLGFHTMAWRVAVEMRCPLVWVSAVVLSDEEPQLIT